MYDLIAADVKRRVTPLQFASAYRAAAATATGTGVRTGKVPDPDGGVVRLPVPSTPGSGARCPASSSCRSAATATPPAWTGARTSSSPGSNPAEHLTRNTALGQRGDILARNGTAPGQRRRARRRLPRGPERRGRDGRARPGPAPRACDRSATRPTRSVGTSGLELALNRQLAGQPGGVLRAGGRTHRAQHARRRATTCARRSTPPRRRRPRPRSATASAGRRPSRPTARSWPWPASPAATSSRRARRSR